jgi:Tol biopolymer transport system component
LAATDRPTDTPQPTAEGLVRLTDDPARDSSPAWSGDSQRIAFYSNRTGVDEIFAMNADGGELIQLTDDAEASFKQEPAWSPDSRQIAFTAFLEKARIFAFDVELAESHPFSPIRSTSQGYPEPLSDYDKDSFAAAWSPDGRRIALVMEDVDGHLQVFTLDLASRDILQVTRAPLDVYRAAWSPDGRWIAFSASAGGNEEIYIIRANGGGMIRLTNDPALDTEPSWSPDGRFIVFSSEREGPKRLFVMRAGGNDVTRLNTGLGEGATPAWSPDGRYIAFVSKVNGNLDIYRIDAPVLEP